MAQALPVRLQEPGGLGVGESANPFDALARAEQADPVELAIPGVALIEGAGKEQTEEADPLRKAGLLFGFHDARRGPLGTQKAAFWQT